MLSHGFKKTKEKEGGGVGVGGGGRNRGKNFFNSGLLALNHFSGLAVHHSRTKETGYF